MSKKQMPFRADIVGSLLRPQPLKVARQKRDRGEMSAADLKDVEDKEIDAIIAKQKEVGLEVATDGEFRRAWWHYDFFGGLDGVKVREAAHGIQFKGVETKAQELYVHSRLGFPTNHPMLAHFAYLKSKTPATPKMTIPSPSVMHFRIDPKSIEKSAYKDRDALFDDLAATYQTAVKAFYDAGCRYLQFDDTVWAYLCSADQLKQAEARGLNPATLAKDYARVINAVLASKHSDMTITTHVCRGNFRSTWISEGGYEPVAELLLGGVAYDGYFLEYDTNRAGGFEPLRFLPKGKKRVVVGLVTSKSGLLEDEGAIKRRLDEATKFAPLDQLCLSPQCGFASTEDGNDLSDEQQWAKLRLIVKIVKEVWRS